MQSSNNSFINNPDKGKVLAFDYGLKRVGVAVSNIERTIAFPLKTIAANEIINFVKTYNIENQISIFVIGYPLDLQGQESDFSQHVKAFANQLSKYFPNIPINYIDERFTSKIASQVIANSNLTKTKRRNKEELDVISATLILQCWISRHSIS